MAQGAKYEPKAVPLGGAIVAVVIAALAGFVVGRVFAGPTEKAAPIEVVKRIPPDLMQKLVGEGDPPTKGGAGAKATVVLFSDFECPYCQKMAPKFEELARRFGDKVRLVFRQFPLDRHPNAKLLAEASLAANAQGKFWEFHDKVVAAAGSEMNRAAVERWAQQIGLDMAALRKALDEHAFAARVDADVALGNAVGISGTPSVIINGQLVRVMPQQLADAVQRVLDGRSLGTPAAAGGRGRAEREPRAAQGPEPLPSEAKDVKVEAWNPSEGPAAAPVTVVLFCEYYCPYCKRIQPTLKKIRDAFGDKVRVVYRNLIIHGPPAEVPALAVLAAAKQGRDRFKKLHDLIFEHQREAREGGRPYIEGLAEQAGLDMARFRADIDSDEIRRQLDADKAEGERVGASGTPSSFINGRFLSGAVPPSWFGKWIDQLLGVPGPTIPASADPQQQAPSGGCGT